MATAVLPHTPLLNPVRTRKHDMHMKWRWMPSNRRIMGVGLNTVLPAKNQAAVGNLAHTNPAVMIVCAEWINSGAGCRVKSRQRWLFTRMTDIEDSRRTLR